MKKLLSLLALLAVAGCAAAPAERRGAQAQVGPAPGGNGPRYEHQLEVVYTDGATPFLHLVEVQDP